MSLNVKQKKKLNIEFCGLQFNTPLVLLSGCVGFGEEYTRINGFSNTDVGAICLKGTTLESRLGNSPHRIAETYLGMLNAIGLQNPGSKVVVDEYLPHLDFEETCFIANLSGSTIEEYEEIRLWVITKLLISNNKWTSKERKILQNYFSKIEFCISKLSLLFVLCSFVFSFG